MTNAVLDVLGYFDHFGHPLSTEEVHRFLSVPASLDEVEKCLLALRVLGEVSSGHGYWCLQGKEACLQERLSNLPLNLTYFNKAREMGALISRFPFVRTVCISGSLSKWGLKPGGDIDYFIITKKNRVWLTKTLLVLYKKLALNGKKDFFCINYLVDEDGLKLKRKNRYQATELATAYPLHGAVHYRIFMQENQWVFQYFPNYVPSQKSSELRPNRLLEMALGGVVGNALEYLCMMLYRWHIERTYLRNWQFRRKSKFEVSPHTSAYFPVNHEPLVLNSQPPSLSSYSA